jgi:pyrophosphatase PpaX
VLGRDYSDDQLLELVGQPLLTQMTYFDAEHADELVEVYRQHSYATHDQQIAYFDGTSEALDQLQALGTRMAVVTSKPNALAKRGLACFELEHYFEFVVGLDDTDKHKPQPEPLLLAASRLDVAADRCIYVGDSPYDMQAARAAKMTAVAATWGMFARQRLTEAGAQYQLNTISELPTLLSNGI